MNIEYWWELKLITMLAVLASYPATIAKLPLPNSASLIQLLSHGPFTSAYRHPRHTPYSTTYPRAASKLLISFLIFHISTFLSAALGSSAIFPAVIASAPEREEHQLAGLTLHQPRTQRIDLANFTRFSDRILGCQGDSCVSTSLS